MNKVDAYYEKHGHWPQIERLRQLILDAGLEETWKWSGPCYTRNGANVVSVGAFRHHLALWFHQGALLPDPEGVLVNAQAGKTRAMRHWRFAPDDRLPITKVRQYLRAAAANADRGGKVSAAPARRDAVVLPEQLKAALSKSRDLSQAFQTLTLSRQREYCEFIEAARKAETVQRRLDKILPLIRAGKGLNDRYRSR